MGFLRDIFSPKQEPPRGAAINKDSRHHSAIALDLFMKGMFNEDIQNECLGHLDKAIELDFRNAEAWKIKGTILSVKSGLFSNKPVEEKFQHQTLACYEKALELDPEMGDGWQNKGELLKSMGRFEEALLCFDHGLSVSSPNPIHLHEQLILSKVDALEKLNEDEKALSILDQLLKTDISVMNKGTAFSDKGKILKKRGEQEEAVRSYRSAVSAYINRKAYSQAIRVSNEILEINPDDAEALFAKGYSIMGSAGEEHSVQLLEEALPCFHRAVELRPAEFNYVFGEAECLKRMGRWYDAIEACDRAIALDPKQEPAWSLKGFVLSRLMRGDEALECLKIASSLNPGSSWAWIQMGEIYGTRGDLNEALDMFNMAIKANQSSQLAWMGKSGELQRLGRTEEAEKIKMMLRGN